MPGLEPASLQLRQDLVTLLKGGFAPNVILLREFHFEKAGIVLDGLPYSAYSLLEHMRERQRLFLNFMKAPSQHEDLWPAAYWPDNPVPAREQAWQNSIASFEKDLEEMIAIAEDADTPLLEVQSNGKTIFWAALASLHHNGYHIGQIKAIGRQLGVW